MQLRRRGWGDIRANAPWVAMPAFENKHNVDDYVTEGRFSLMCGVLQ